MSSVTKPIILNETGVRIAEALEAIAETGDHIIAVQDNEPADPETRIWLPETEPDPIQVPTLADLQAVEAAAVKPKNTGTEGQILSIDNEGDPVWANVGTPTDAQVAEAVEDWLDDHPEATTTVEDGAITRAKLNSDLQDIVDDVPTLKNEIVKKPEVKESTKTGVDLDVTDSAGNVLARFANGHIMTSKFNSAESGIDNKKSVVQADLDIADAAGNVLLRLKNGNIQTKKFDSADEFELPERYKAYMDGKIQRINELMLAAGGNGDAFIFVTDEHWQLNAKQSPALINYIIKNTKIDKVFAGGDLINGGSDEYAELFRRAANGRCYRANGNHDYMDGGTESKLAYYYESSLDDEHGNPARRYFYVDNPKHRVRYVILNDFKQGNSGWDWGYEADQITWMTDVAFDVEVGWSIFIISHMFWKNVSEQDPGLQLETREEDVLDIIDSNNTNGKIKCILQGHTHVDALKVTSGGIPIIITGSDKYLPAVSGNESWLHNRVLGTTTEQCFDVCVWNGYTEEITAVRIGGFATGDDDDDETLIEAGERTVTY